MKIFLTAISLIFGVVVGHAGVYQIKNNQLHLDGVAQPQLFGAEVQYFRIRGGYEPNRPRADVMKLWEAALDHLVESHMNTISFYIPWDFHEYAPGKFDFDGTVDEDGDGNPDYPARDLKTFFNMIQERGIKNILVRPGPYINAEWGFLGFGAIPLWFHLKYPDSHMQNSAGESTKLYDYHNPDLLRHTRLWFEKLYTEVLKDKIGPGKPISFLQLDNETNFMWQSLYNHDYSPPTILRYQEFLKAKYKTLDALNKQHQRSWSAFDKIKAPISAQVNIAEDQDWYAFADVSIASYLEIVRKIWEDIGVREPNVLFTLADSYNATQNGLLPNYQLHNQNGLTGLLTVNLYPKTYETSEHPLLNLPFKTDHDVKAADSASEYYFKNGERWAMGPEIQAGWWQGISVSTEARQQTYLSVLGHGLKALIVYYFNEGDNWQVEWAKNQITPYYTQLHAQPDYQNFKDKDLPSIFWNSLQKIVDHQIVSGFDVRSIMQTSSKSAEQLYFDAPLSYGIIPSEHFYKLKEIGEKLIQPHGEWLGAAVELTDDVCLLKDQEQNIPSYLANIDNVEMNSTWESGLVGYLLQSGINPKIIHWELNSSAELKTCRMIIRQDSGETSTAMAFVLKKLTEEGRTLVNFLDDSLAQKMHLGFQSSSRSATEYFVHLDFKDRTFAARASPLFQYQQIENSNCQSIIFHDGVSVAYKCALGAGHFVQIGALFYDTYNSNDYGRTTDLAARTQILKSLLIEANIKSTLEMQIAEDDPAFGKIVAFARKVKSQDPLWITIKSALASATNQKFLVRGLEKNRIYHVQDLLSQEVRLLKGQEIEDNGILVNLASYGSTVYWIY